MERGQGGTALHLAGDGWALPLGVVVIPAKANTGCHPQERLAVLVVPPPAPTTLSVQGSRIKIPAPKISYCDSEIDYEVLVVARNSPSWWL